MRMGEGGAVVGLGWGSGEGEGWYLLAIGEVEVEVEVVLRCEISEGVGGDGNLSVVCVKLRG